MAVNRISSQIDLDSSGTIVFVYGKVQQEEFIDKDLQLYDIERILWKYLLGQGFKRIVFFNASKRIYFWDLASIENCFSSNQSTQKNTTNSTLQASGKNKRPLGGFSVLGKRQQQEVQYTPKQRNRRFERVKGGYYQISSTIDVESAKLLDTYIKDESIKTALVFSQFDILEMQRGGFIELLHNLNDWSNLSAENPNKCFLLFKSRTADNLSNTLGSSAPIIKQSLEGLFNDSINGRGLRSHIEVNNPQLDEIERLVQRARLREDKSVDWRNLEKITRRFQQEGKSLKFWIQRLKKLDAFSPKEVRKSNIVKINNLQNKPASERLQELIGLKTVKSAVEEHIMLVKAARQRPSLAKDLNFHMTFEGNPGTGKTTVARLVAEIFREEGIFSTGRYVEGDRERMVAAYAGQTATKTKELCKQAKGGVFFIDEAYALGENRVGGNTDQFGKEAIDTLIKVMEDDKDDLCVILAGYTDPMEGLLNTNPGFKSRIGKRITFEDYTPEELFQIFELKRKSQELEITPELETAIVKILTSIYNNRNKNFGNGREVERLLDVIKRKYIIRCNNESLDIDTSPMGLIDVPDKYKKILGLPLEGKGTKPKKSALDQLRNLIGLDSVKEAVEKHLIMAKAAKQLPSLAKDLNFHMTFEGNPGTGKTTVARLVAKIFQEEGILVGGQLIEADRERMVASYTGQTATKTKELCEKAMGGVLFIDEAYALGEKQLGGSVDSFGKEAIDTLIKVMEDKKDNLCVILAGYTDPMEGLLKTNPGFKSRIGERIVFEDYTPNELFQIFELKRKSQELETTPKLEEAIKKILTAIHSRRSKDFGNGREAERLLSDIKKEFVRRCYKRNLDIDATPMDLVDIPKEYRLIVGIYDKDADTDRKSALERLESLIGLDAVKEAVRKHLAMVKATRRVPELGKDLNFHMTFEGNPGTGKTTVARLVAQIFQEEGILYGGQLVEGDRESMVAGFVGQTAIKTKELCEKAIGGVLFIDEAYALGEGGLGGSVDSFGKEAVDTLIKVMEDKKENLCVVLAGYTAPMERLLKTNPGFKSRIGKRIIFEDYTAAELFKIFQLKVKSQKILVSDDLKLKIRQIFDDIVKNKGKDFGNGREVERLLSSLKQNYVFRCDLENRDIKETPMDIIDLPQKYKTIPTSSKKTPAQISCEKKSTKEENKETNFSYQDSEKDQKSNMQQHYGAGDNVLGDKYIIYSKDNVDSLDKKLTYIPDIEKINFHGRENILKTIHTDLADTNILLLNGLAGLGKTSTSIKYIDKYGDYFQHLVWIDCKSSIIESFLDNSELLKKIKLEVGADDPETERFEILLKKLERISKSILIIIDNVEKKHEKELLEIQFPKNIKLLLTSRDHFTNLKSLEIDVFDFTEAKKVFSSSLENNYRSNIDDDDLKLLFESIGYHTLAIEMLAKTLSSRKDLNFLQLLETVKKNGLDIQQINEENGIQTVIDLISNLFDLSNLDYTERQVMRYLSVLPSNFLDFDTLQFLFKIDALELNRIIAVLQREGYLQENNDKKLRCHQIIQEITRNQLKPEVANTFTLVSQLGKGLEDKYDFSSFDDALKASSKYLGIVSSLLKFISGETILFADIYRNIGIMYRTIGSFKEALKWHIRDVEIRRKLEQVNNIEYVVSIEYLADAHDALGEYSNTKNLLLEANDLIIKINDNKKKAEIFEKLGVIYRKEGDLIESGRYLENAVSIYKDFEDELSSKQVAKIQNSLGRVLLEKGEFEKGEEFLVEAVNYYENETKKTISVDEIDTYLNIALLHVNTTEFSKAEFYIARAEKLANQFFSKDSLIFASIYYHKSLANLVQILTEYNRLATYNFDAAVLKDAAKDLHEGIRILKQFRPVNHKDFAYYYLNIGRISNLLQENEEEIHKWKQKVLDITKTYREKNVYASMLYFLLVTEFGNILSDEEAIEYLESALNVLPEGPEYDQNLGIICVTLGSGYSTINVWQKAKHYLYLGYKAYKRFFKDEHPIHVFCLQSIAEVHQELGEYKEALDKQEKLVEICSRNMEEYESDFAIPYGNLSVLYSLNNNYKKALVYKQKFALSGGKITDIPEIENVGQFVLLKNYSKDGGYIHCILPPNYKITSDTNIQDIDYAEVIEEYKNADEVLAKDIIYSKQYGDSQRILN